MSCTRPLKAYRGREGAIAFSSRDGYYDQHLELACGQCIGCRLKRSRDWAARMMYEAREHDANCFLTLTYADEHLPEDHGLDVSHWQKFAKRLRRRMGSFRFYHCGEYGEQRLRPHYHACLFGIDFAESRQYFDTTDSGDTLYSSPILDELWPFGWHSIGELTYDSAAYVARYVTKKITGKQAEEHYERVDLETGEVWSVRPEYSTMSRRPGIGRAFFEKHRDEIYQHDSVVFKGSEYAPPRYFDKLLGEHSPEVLAKTQKRRRARVIAHQSRETRDKEDVLRIREKIQTQRTNNLSRLVD